MKKVIAILTASLMLGRGVFAQDAGVASDTPFSDADAGVYQVVGGYTADGGVIAVEGFLFAPERVIKIGVHVTELENRNARLLEENQKLTLERDQARTASSPPIFGAGFWTGVAVGSVLTVVLIGGTAVWIASKTR